MDGPSPTPTEGFLPLVFAKLYPNNKLACQCFSDVVDEIILGNLAPQAQFLEYGTEQVTLEKAITHSTQDDGRATEQETETEIDTEVEEAFNAKVWTGAYILSLERLPAVPALGWRIGRFVEKTVRESTPRQVDLLLCRPDHAHVRGNHARLAFDPKSGILMVHSRHRRTRDGVTLNGETFNLSGRALHERSSTLRFGDLEYILTYTIAANSTEERYFQTDKKDYFGKVLSSCPPLESTSSTPSSEDITVGKWKLHTELGRGAYGSVSAASHSTGKIVAFKSLLRYNKSSAQAVSKEIEMANTITELLRDDDHHIIRLVQVIYQRGDSEYDHRRPENVWILYTPLVQGTIGDMLSPKRHSIKHLTRTHAFQQLLLGLKWLHSHRLVHRDIKVVNIGISLDPLHVSILDLGTVCKLDDSTDLIAPSPGQLGTVHYLAPEMELEDYDGKVDIWASGIVGCEIFLGYHPWPLSVNPWRSDKNPKLDDYKARHSQFLQSLKQNSESQREFIVLSLIADMLQWDPKARPSSQNALEHQCFLSFTDHELQNNEKRRKTG